MMKTRNTRATHWLFILLFSLSFSGKAQEVIQPSVIYNPGDTLLAPTYGIAMVLRDNWYGELTRETVVFTMKCDTLNDLTIFLYPNSNQIEKTLARWNAGVETRPGTTVIPAETLKIRDDEMGGKIRIKENNSTKGYIYSRMGPYNSGFTLIMAYSLERTDEFYEDLLEDLITFIGFIRPRAASEITMAERLTGTYVYSYKLTKNSSRTDQVWLCKDGTFRSQLKKRGLDKKINKEYQGQKSGTYKLEGDAASGKLTLTFKKLEPVTVDLVIRDGMLYINSQRFFFNRTQECN